MTVSEKDMERIAELANLELTPDERSRMAVDLNSILAHIAQLNELETAAIPPMIQAAAQSGRAAADGPSASNLRPDVLAPSLDRDRVLASAPETDGVFFKTPKVIER